VDTDAVLELICEVAATAITPRFRSLADGEVSEKKPGDLVTVADHEAEVLITRALRAAFPECVVLGEEATAADPSLPESFAAAEHGFTVDPVDGTKNFVEGSPDHAVMVSEVRGGFVTRAWIHQPQHGVSWVAERGGGVRRDGVTVGEPAGPPVGEPPRVITSIRALRGVPLGDWPGAGPSWRCCGVDYPRLAEGACDAILYARGAAWDHAPGSLIVSELGGVVGHADGAGYDPRVSRGGIVVARDPDLFAELVERLPDAFRSRAVATA
jgi:fructose-1,6-bisphosphatase/inositol monophosphatase family enzyme